MRIGANVRSLPFLSFEAASVQLSRRSLVKARLASDGSVAMLLAMRSTTNPAWTLVLSGDTSVLNMSNATRLGVSVCFSQL